MKIWRDGERLREELLGGPRAGYYAIADGERWWLWDSRVGARSNESDVTVASDVGQEMKALLEPSPLLGALRFEVTGRSTVAGRPTISANAWPRPRDPKGGTAIAVQQLGFDADEYKVEVDLERGTILAVTAMRSGERSQVITALAITFDLATPSGLFRFVPPDA